MKAETKRLIRVAIPLGIVLLIRFGGAVILALFGLGWRCTPRNIMNIVCMLLLLITTALLSTMIGAKYPWISLLGCLSIIALGFGIVMYSQVYWHDSIKVQKGVAVVTESNGHGSIGERRCFIHVNDLLHGRELGYDWSAMRAVIPEDVQ